MFTASSSFRKNHIESKSAAKLGQASIMGTTMGTRKIPPGYGMNQECSAEQKWQKQAAFLPSDSVIHCVLHSWMSVVA
jgi:hypothetical protein